jgi:hypothetical protein
MFRVGTSLTFAWNLANVEVRVYPLKDAMLTCRSWIRDGLRRGGIQ